MILFADTEATMLTQDQPEPMTGSANVNERVRELLPALLEARQRRGLECYGTPLMTFNGRDAGRDLLEELLDALAYAVQLQMEHAVLAASLADSVKTGITYWKLWFQAVEDARIYLEERDQARRAHDDLKERSLRAGRYLEEQLERALVDNQVLRQNLGAVAP